MYRVLHRPSHALTLRGPLWARRLVAMAAVALVAFVTMAQGYGYIWCAPMQRVMSRPCCPQAHADADAEAHHGPSVEAPCCEGRRVGSLPAADAPTVAYGAIAPAPFLLLLSALWFVLTGAPRALVRARGRLHPVRAGPRPKLFLLHAQWLN